MVRSRASVLACASRSPRVLPYRRSPRLPPRPRSPTQHHRDRRHVVAVGRYRREAGGVPGHRGEHGQEHSEQHRGHRPGGRGLHVPLVDACVADVDGRLQPDAAGLHVPPARVRQVAPADRLLLPGADDRRPLPVQGRGQGVRERQGQLGQDVKQHRHVHLEHDLDRCSCVDADFVAGHSLAVGRSFSTGGIDCAGAKLPRAATMRRSRLGT